jgi:hypothetical protein
MLIEPNSALNHQIHSTMCVASVTHWYGGSAYWSDTPFETQMFQLSAVITTSIAATRVYRSLVDFSLKTTDL